MSGLFQKIVNLVKTEPALVLGAIGALISLLLAFGVHLSQTEVGAIMAFVTAVIALVLRQNVIPMAKLDENGNFKDGV